MKETSRFLRKLRRTVYRETPVASVNSVVEIDWRAPYETLRARFAGGDCGVGAAGAALVLWRAARDAGFRAWCYEFGFPDSYLHSVTVIEADGALEVHDAFLNQGYRAGFFDILGGLRGDRLPEVRCETRDRKICLVEPRRAVEWLVVHADRELEPVGPLRRFEVRWDADALAATEPGLDRVYRALEGHGHPAELAYLMLHPVAVFDGVAHHRDRRTMPLVGSRDLYSPSAALRAALRRLTGELAEERQQAAERAAAAHRLEIELVETRGRLAASGAETVQLSARLSELCDSLSREAERHALERELAAATAVSAAAEQKIRDLEQQIAELRRDWEQRAATWQAERHSLQIARAQAMQDLARARAELFLAEPKLAAARLLVGDWRLAFERATRDWAGERRSLRAASEVLADDNSRLEAELLQAREEAAGVREELAAARATLASLIAEREAERAAFDAARRRRAGRWRSLGLRGALRALFARSPAEQPKLSPARGRTI